MRLEADLSITGSILFARILIKFNEFNETAIRHNFDSRAMMLLGRFDSHCSDDAGLRSREWGG